MIDKSIVHKATCSVCGALWMEDSEEKLPTECPFADDDRHLKANCKELIAKLGKPEETKIGNDTTIATEHMSSV